MTLTNARYFWRDGYPMLSIEIDGHVAVFCSDVKPGVHNSGYVVVDAEGLEFPDVTISPYGQPVTLSSATNNRRLWTVYDQFLQACNSDADFPVGPVSIPA